MVLRNKNLVFLDDYKKYCSEDPKKEYHGKSIQCLSRTEKLCFLPDFLGTLCQEYFESVRDTILYL